MRITKSHPTARIGAGALACALVLMPVHSSASEGPETESEAYADSDAEALEMTVQRIRNTGTALIAWLTDQVGAGAAGQQTLDLSEYPIRSPDDLQELLVPDYLPRLHRQDGWGNDLEFRLSSDVLAQRVMVIRSPGRDGIFDGPEYTIGAFPASEFDQDIVWADGYFARWPDRPGK